MCRHFYLHLNDVFLSYRCWCLCVTRDDGCWVFTPRETSWKPLHLVVKGAGVSSLYYCRIITTSSKKLCSRLHSQLKIFFSNVFKTNTVSTLLSRALFEVMKVMVCCVLGGLLHWLSFPFIKHLHEFFDVYCIVKINISANKVFYVLVVRMVI